MEHSFWDARWSDGRIGFHLDQVNPTLVRHFDEFLRWLGRDTATAATVLVPLCGKSLDMAWLAERSRAVVGVEFVRTAAEQYFAERGVEPDVDANAFVHGNTSIVVDDFFRVGRARIGGVELVYDRAALVAIAPEHRVRYLSQLWRLLEPNGGLFLISFEHDTGTGPPFSIDRVDELFDAAALQGAPFELLRHSERDLLQIEPQFRERGASYLREVLFFARKR